MSRQLFSVVIVKGEWAISHGGKYRGTFPNQKASIRAAIDMANNAGGDAQVMCMAWMESSKWNGLTDTTHIHKKG